MYFLYIYFCLITLHLFYVKICLLGARNKYLSTGYDSVADISSRLACEQLFVRARMVIFHGTRERQQDVHC